MPFSVDPELEKIATSGIYDWEFWGIDATSGLTDEDLSRADIVQEMRQAARGRRIVVALGQQEVSKGFGFFSDIWCAPENARLREEYLFVAAGNVDPAVSRIADTFARNGGLLVNRFLSGEEMGALLLVGDLAWSCFAPSRDLSSGIFSRSFQMGIPAIVRKGAYIARIGRQLGYPMVELEWDKPGDAAETLRKASLPRQDRAVSGRMIAEIRSLSLKHLGDALGIGLRP